MKLRLGPAGIPITSKDRSTLGGIKRVAELKLQSLEVEFVRGVKMSNALAKEAGQLAKKLDIELSVHAPYYINLCNPEKQAASIKRILMSCERAHYLGASPVVFHPGYAGKDREACFQMVKKACQKMLQHINKRGWKVRLGPETTGKLAQICNLEETVRLCKEVPGCEPVIDWAHIYARNQGRIDFGAVLDVLRPLKLKHLHCHFSCINYGPGGEKNHLTLDAKKPDYQPLVKELLKRRPFNITLISESPILEQDALVLKSMFEKAGYRF